MAARVIRWLAPGLPKAHSPPETLSIASDHAEMPLGVWRPAVRTPLLPIVVAAAALSAGCADKTPPPPPPPPEVTVGSVVQQDVPVYMELVGQTSGAQDVEIRARVEGYVERVAFAEGTVVNKGDLLYVVDPKPF